jgi:hypothetical protein
MKSPWDWRVVKTLTGLVLLAVIGIAVLLISMGVDHIRITSLPEPTGKFAVGRTTWVWSDRNWRSS